MSKLTKTGKRCIIRLTELEELVVSLSIPGSARHSHCRGQGFDSPMLHQKTLQIKACKVFSCPLLVMEEYADLAQRPLGKFLKGFLSLWRPRNPPSIKTGHFLVQKESGLFWARFRPVMQGCLMTLIQQHPYSSSEYNSG